MENQDHKTETRVLRKRVEKANESADSWFGMYSD